MRNFRTPGVYIREVEVKAPPRVRMDIAGFAGHAERGPLNSPQPLTSWGEYRDIFGGFIGYGYLPYCVFTFFMNGGARCYVARVVHETAVRARGDLAGRDRAAGDLLFHIEAINEGEWGNGVEVVSESESSDDLILTELSAPLEAGADEARFESVAGLQGGLDGEVKGDRLKLLHPALPTVQEQVSVDEVRFDQGVVSFDKPVSRDFPAGTRVLGRGFRLTFRYTREGRLERGELFDNLSADPSHERYFVRVINGDPEERDYIKRLRAGQSILVRVSDLCAAVARPCPRPPAQRFKLSGGSDGERESVGINYLTGYKDGDYFRPPAPRGASPADIARRREQLFGLAVFEAVEEIGLVALPDLALPDLHATANAKQIPVQGIVFAAPPRGGAKFERLKNGQADLLTHCQKMGERFAILDSPRGAEIARGENKIEEWPNNFQLLPGARFGALYYPWLRQKTGDFDGRELFVPPSGAVAGIYSRSEQARGVGKAPANEVLQGAVELEFCLDDAEQSLLNPKGVNCLRSFPGRGLRVWGARTLSPEPLSVYVNVRRVVLSVVKNIIVSLRWTVFEPNDRQLRDRITASLTLLLNGLFASGALVGASAREAFFVKCDEETNPPEVVEQGQLVTEVGVAPERPAEFILVTIKRSPGALSVFER